MIGGIIVGIIKHADWTRIVINGTGCDKHQERIQDVHGTHGFSLGDDIWWQSELVMWSSKSLGFMDKKLKRRRLDWQGKVIKW